MVSILNSLKKLAVFLFLTVVLAGITIAVFEFFIAGPTNLPMLLERLGTITIIFFFSAIALYFLSKTKRLLTPHIGIRAATIMQFLLIGLAILIIAFSILASFNVSLTTLITSAGIITITVGLIISTFVGGILSGALVFTNYQFQEGEDVLINNVPGKVIEMSALVMRIRTDVGQITIPNSAIASGGVIVTSVRKPEATQETRLIYKVGDRVITSFKLEEGIVKEVTAFHTVVLLDSGREITFLNNSVLSGAVAIAKITQNPTPT
ncbi:MAG: mechanosensitive ion channel family protein [Candidatus Bathyarchaeota archaeon]|nr:mechanosensitive ion channel family protein [Candidatus Bathyarchaeota archaeon]